MSKEVGAERGTALAPQLGGALQLRRAQPQGAPEHPACPSTQTRPPPPQKPPPPWATPGPSSAGDPSCVPSR